MTLASDKHVPIPRHDWDMALRFLELLAPSATEHTFLLIPEGPTPKGSTKVRHGSLEAHWSEFTRLNTLSQRHGVFVTINETDLTGRRRENIQRVRAFFIDCDTPDSVGALLANNNPASKPDILVTTSKERAHAYWLVEDCPLEMFASIQKALIRKFGSDPSIHDLSRVMRLPGTLHMKGQPTLVCIQGRFDCVQDA